MIVKIKNNGFVFTLFVTKDNQIDKIVYEGKEAKDDFKKYLLDNLFKSLKTTWHGYRFSPKSWTVNQLWGALLLAVQKVQILGSKDVPKVNSSATPGIKL